jgi:hypothetical protein
MITLYWIKMDQNIDINMNTHKRHVATEEDILIEWSGPIFLYYYYLFRKLFVYKRSSVLTMKCIKNSTIYIFMGIFDVNENSPVPLWSLKKAELKFKKKKIEPAQLKSMLFILKLNLSIFGKMDFSFNSD